MARVKGAKGKHSTKASRDCAKMNAAAAKIQAAFRGRKSKKVNKVGKPKPKGNMADALATVAERKVQQLTAQYSVRPRNQDGTSFTSPVFFQNYVLGDAPADWSFATGQQGFTGLDGYVFPQGTGSNARIGRYMFLEQATVNLKVAMQNVSGAAGPTRFRVLLYKFRRNALLGNIGNPNDDLFISSAGNPMGINTFFLNSIPNVGKASFELMNAITNRKNYTIYEDDSFILQSSLTTQSQPSQFLGGMSQSYPSEKDYLWKLRHNEKASFDAASKPNDVQYQYCMTIMSAPVGSVGSITHDDWTTSVRGTVSALDA